MSKRILLTFNGYFETGFDVRLRIEELSVKEISSQLPENLELANALETHWQDAYPNVDSARSHQENYWEKLLIYLYLLEVTDRSIDTELGIKESLNFRITLQKVIYGGSINHCKQSAQHLQSLFNSWLMSEDFFPVRDELLVHFANADREAEEETIVLIQASDRRIQKLPWHRWNLLQRYRNAQVEFVLSSLDWETPRSQYSPRERVKILAILGDSDGINVDGDRQLLETLPNAEVTFLVEPPRRLINDRLWQGGWDIIFFAGHSQTENDEGRMFINADDSLTVNELWYGLRKAVDGGLRIAIFNSCDGLGLAWELDDIEIPLTVVMRELVPDRVAQEFLKNFLQAFSSGKSFYLSVKESREKLQGLEDEIPCASWLPIIYQNPVEVPPKWDEMFAVSPSPPPPPPRLSLFRFVVAASFIITSFVFWGRWQGHLQEWELQAYDRLMQQRPMEQIDDRITIVSITPQDVERLDQPLEEKGAKTLSNRTLNTLIEKIEQHSPAVIGLNLFLQGEIEPEFASLKSSLRSGNIILPCRVATDNYPSVSATPDAPNSSVGFHEFVVDNDDIVRRYLMEMTVQDPQPCRENRIHAFTFKIAEQFVQNNKSEFRDDIFNENNSKKFQLVKSKQGGYHQLKTTIDRSVGDGVQVMLNYRPYHNYRQDIVDVLSIAKVLDDRISEDKIKNRIVLIGRDDPNTSLGTPYSRELPVLFLNAQILSNILDVFDGKRPAISTLVWWQDGLWMWMWSLLGGIVAWKVGDSDRLWGRSLLKIVGATAILWVALRGLCLYFLIQGYWLPFVPSLLALLCASISITVYVRLRKKRD